MTKTKGRDVTRVTLIHNPGAGDAEHASDELSRMLSGAGYEVDYRSTEDDDFEGALAGARGMVVVAGGDGTVRKVAKRLVGRGVPLGVLPLGTANNIAQSLGLGGDAGELAEGLRSARRMKFDVGVARGPWGAEYFFEGFGLGLFTDVMTELDAREEREPALFERAADPLATALRALREALPGYRAHDLRLRLDGEDLSGRYLMVEAMNISRVGPNLFLAPDADPSDGLLDVVVVSEEGREEFGQYLEYRLEGKQDAPLLCVRRGRRLEFSWDGPLLRFDDETWPKKKGKKAAGREWRDGPAAVEVTLEHAGLEFLIPQGVGQAAPARG